MAVRFLDKLADFVANQLLALASFLTPPHLRARWLEEWRAELWYRRRQSGTWRALRDFAGALRDAVASRGLPSARAHRSSHRPLGSVEIMKNDIKFAMRSLLRRPGFTVVALATLAVGFGATTAMFIAVRAVVLEPLPYPAADRLVRLYERRPHQGRERNPLSLPDYVDWHAAQLPVFEGMALYTFAGANLTGVEQPEALLGAAVRDRFFDVLQVEPVVGRVFREAEQGPGAERVVILSHGLWQRVFGGDAAVLQNAIQFDGNPYTVVGVMPPGVGYPFEAEFWIPLRDDPATSGRGSHGYEVIARLAPGISVDRAFRDLNVVAERLEDEYPDSNTQHYANVVPMSDVALGTAPVVLWLLLGAVGFVLLIVCTNVANMQLARGIGRQREFAIRTSLGASRGRIVKQLLTENALLGLCGGAAGLVVAWWLSNMLEPKVIETAPWLPGIGVDLLTAMAAVLGSVVVAVAFGAVPAVVCSRTGFSNALRDGARASHGVGHRRIRSALVAAEVALAVLLLVGAGLTTRSLWRLVSVDPGFDPEGVVALEIALPRAGYEDGAQRTAFFDELEQRLAAAPGTESVGYTWLLPFSENEAGRNFTIEGREPPSSGDSWNARWRIADAGYFETMGIPLRRGRLFERTDREDAPRVAVVGETMARRFWPDGDAIGSRFRLSPEDPWVTIVGIVGDVRHRGLDVDPNPEFYFHRLQTPSGYGTIVARGAAGVGSLTTLMRGTMRELDPQLPISSLATMQSYIDGTVAQRRLTASIVGAFGGTALLLAAIGIYGVISYTVGQRRHEIGVRIALGGRSTDVLRLFLGEGMRIVGVGLVVGLAGALVVTRFIDSFLFGVAETDLVSFGGAAAVLAAVALAAIVAPAQRATKVDPMVSFRAE